MALSRKVRVAPLRVFLTVILVGSASPVSAPAQQTSCAGCHEDVAAAVRGHLHERADVGCVACHGGDPEAEAKEKSHGPPDGFLGTGERLAWVRKCGECHADVREMNPYGLPTDQLAQYRTSRHGELLADLPDAEVATCVECHGAHGILPPTNRTSPVHPTNVPATCARCHGDAEFGEEHDLDTSVVEEYRRSVHGKLLLDDGDVSAPQCATCHGNHGAVPPGFLTVSAVCGKCHVRQQEKFEESPHAPLTEEGLFDACVTCHGKHAVEHPTEETFFRPVCSLCHSEGSEPFEARANIVADFEATRVAYRSAKEALASTERRGLPTEQQQLMLENAHTTLLEMEVAQHALDAEVIEEMARQARSTFEALESQLVAAREAAVHRRIALIPVVIFLALMSVGFWVRFRRIEKGRGS